MRTTRLLMIHALPFVLSCAGTPQAIAQTEAIPPAPRPAEQQNWKDFLEKGIPVLFCPPEIRAWLTKIRSECPSAAPPAAPAAPVSGPGTEGAEAAAAEATSDHGRQSCPTEQLRGAFAPLKKQFNNTLGATLLSYIPRHVIVYMSPDNDQLADAREKQIQAVAEEYRFPKTRFTIIVSPGKGGKFGEPDADRRGKTIINHLIKYGVPPQVIDGPWLYPLGLKAADLTRLTDKPVTNEASDLNRAVVILRTEG